MTKISPALRPRIIIDMSWWTQQGSLVVGVVKNVKTI
jgi:hypothetical protein